MKNKEHYNEYIEIFLQQNLKLNLISKNDEKYLWEKHIFDSLSIENFFNKYPDAATSTLLDIGTGGGFPSVPIAVTYPKTEVYALDSINKKINAIFEIKEKLQLQNLHPICGRAENLIHKNLTHENLTQKFDLITTRAVAPLKTILEYAVPLLKKNGYFIAYKSIKAKDEIEDAKSTLKKFNAKVVDIIEYSLPMKDSHTRYLVVISK